MTKVKKEKVEAEEAAEVTEKSYQELIANVNPIAQPLASKKLSKKLYKCVKKAAKVKNIRRGVKEVQKFINKGEKGIVVLAGDTLPIDVYCHLPVMCEDRNLPYAYIPSKVDLGSSAGSKRPTCVILIKPHEDYQDAYDEVLEEVSSLPKPLIGGTGGANMTSSAPPTPVDGVIGAATKTGGQEALNHSQEPASLSWSVGEDGTQSFLRS